jgi:thymidylate kinase
MYIFEGPDGCGKTTLMKAVADKLSAWKRPIHVVTEPGTTDIGIQARTWLKNRQLHDQNQEVLAMLLARRALYKQLHASLQRYPDTIILSDRGTLSTMVYQRKAEDGYVGLALTVEQEGIELLGSDFRTIYVRTPLGLCLERVKARGETIEKVADAWEQYELVFDEVSDCRLYLAVDGLLPLEEQAAKVVSYIEEEEARERG